MINFLKADHTGVRRSSLKCFLLKRDLCKNDCMAQS